MALTRAIRTTLLTLLGLILFWVLLSIFWAPPHLIATTPYPVDQTPATRNLDYQDITIPSGDLLLEGWWIPASQPIAELIFVHGAGTNRISQYIGSLDFYRTLHELNISVVTMDIRNHGNSPVTDGTLRMGLAEWPDVVATAQWLDRERHQRRHDGLKGSPRSREGHRGGQHRDGRAATTRGPRTYHEERSTEQEKPSILPTR